MAWQRKAYCSGTKGAGRAVGGGESRISYLLHGDMWGYRDLIVNKEGKSSDKFYIQGIQGMESWQLQRRVSTWNLPERIGSRKVQALDTRLHRGTSTELPTTAHGSSPCLCRTRRQVQMGAELGSRPHSSQGTKWNSHLMITSVVCTLCPLRKTGKAAWATSAHFPFLPMYFSSQLLGSPGGVPEFSVSTSPASLPVVWTSRDPEGASTISYRVKGH